MSSPPANLHACDGAAIRHEIVWELTPDHLSKHKLLGGMGGKASTSVLVLINKAKRVLERIDNMTLPEIARP